RSAALPARHRRRTGARRPPRASQCYTAHVSTVGEAAKYAGGMYGTAGRRLRHPARSVEDEAKHLHQGELGGETGETPFPAILGLILFSVPLGIAMGLLAFGAAWLFG